MPKISELSGTTIGDGKYELVRPLGKGNFGTVYRARELMNGNLIREVAVKLYDPEAAKAGRIEGMLQDCALPAHILDSAAPIEHKRHFVPIYNFGEIDTDAGRTAFVAMELVRGGVTLEHVAEQNKTFGSFPGEKQLLDYMGQFFTALSLAHERNILHRDIKGANVILQNGVIRVLDFGMGAYLERPGTPLKTTMSIYAPENFEGQYTAASDIYQAGLMFYELYTGVQPYEDHDPFKREKDMFKEKMKRMQFRFQPGKNFPDTQPSERIDAILEGCLRYRQEDRFSSAQAVLKMISGSDPIEAARQAVLNGDLPKAREAAERALRGECSDEEQIEMLVISGDADAAENEDQSAVEKYKRALGKADESGVFFNAPAKYNALIDKVSFTYRKMGRSQIARNFENRKKRV